jgi:RsiW-degrading membrane proteinase PrsW (M82 family)
MDFYLGAAVATVVAVAIYGLGCIMFAPRRDRAIVIAAALLAAVAVLPLTLLILPFQARWQAQLFDTRFLRALVVLIQTPLIEEPAKWLVLLSPWIRRSLRTDNAFPIALAIGLGFAVGEIWAQAYHLASPQFVQAQSLLIPSIWAVGRFVTPVVHGGLVAFVAIRMAAGRSIWPGALIGLTLHLMADLPFLARHGDAVFGNAQPMALTLANLANLAVIIVLTLFVFKGLIEGLGLNFRKIFQRTCRQSPKMSAVEGTPAVPSRCVEVSV